MSLCVPEWDRSGGMLDAVIPSNDFHGPVNGKGDVVRSKRSHFSQLTLASVPDQDSLDLGWNDNGHIDMQGQSSKGSKSQWQHINYTPGWNGGQETEDGVTPCKPDTPKSGVSLETVVNETATEAHPAQNPDVENDEMVSWLQYPLDDTLERNYCSDFFGELPEANTHLASLRESFGQTSIKSTRTPLLGPLGNDAVLNRATTADTAMLMGAGRAAGILPQAGVEAFSKVRTLHSVHSLQPSSVTRWQQPHTPGSSNGSSLCGTTSMTSAKASAPTSTPATNPMLPPKTQPVPPVLHVQTPQCNRSGSMNFSHFSRPAALVKANLHSLAVNGGPPPNARFKNQMGRPILEASTSSGSSIVDPTTMGQGPSGPRQEVKAQTAAAAEREQSNGIDNSRWQAAPGLSPNKDRDCVMSVGDCKSLPTDQETCRLSSVTNGAVLASSEKGASHGTQHPDVQEPTITSSSGGYGTCANERPKEAAASTKRKSSEREDTECQSEDGEDESVDTKKPVTGRGTTTKRSRAAEVHNQSERRRRDRINEKMRALQELIPNSNKTDKASMLDEAIEYLKMLQLQLQMMSIRTGMTLPPMVVPSGLQQHMPMPQMAGMPSMGMGMGMVPMGLGMGMMDTAPQGRAMLPMQSHAGPSFNGNMASASSLVDVHGYQQPGVLDYNSYMARPHQPMQMTQALSIDKYNAYMLQQHQLQQQQQQQQQQHQHPQQQHQPHQQHHQSHQHQPQQQPQQHQNHQQAPSMGVGPPH